jgi:hypothetical protein
MRANEFITEGGPARSKPHKNHQDTEQGHIIARDVGGYDRVYHQNRLGMAMAMADGKSTKKVKMDTAGPTEKFNSYHPYTDEEHNMLQSALKTIPSEHHTNTKRSKSKEPDDTHRVSPVLGFKGFGKEKKKKK